VQLTDGRPLQTVTLALLRKRGLVARLCLPEGRLRSFLSDVEEAYHPHNPYHNSCHAADVVQVRLAESRRRWGGRWEVPQFCWAGGVQQGVIGQLLWGLAVPALATPQAWLASWACMDLASTIKLGQPAIVLACCPPSLTPAPHLQALGAMLAVDEFAAHLSDLEQLAVILAACLHDVGHPGVSNDFLIRTQSEVRTLKGGQAGRQAGRRANDWVFGRRAGHSEASGDQLP